MDSTKRFIVIYSFKTISGKEKEFINAWEEMTKLIYEFAGSLGSRLHKAHENLFIAYAQWPSKDAFHNSSEKLPAIAKEIRLRMRECCSEVKIEFEIEETMDLLSDNTFNSFN